MVRYIVAPAAGTPADEAVIGCALAVAAIFGAHVDFVHVRVDVARVAVAAGSSGAVIAPASIDAMETDETAAEQRARASVTRLCGAAGVPLSPTGSDERKASADFLVQTGNEAKWLAEYGRFADLIVVGRRADGGGDAGIDVLETVLLDSNRPVLIAPAAATPAITGTVVIAWTDSQAALRAVHAAMPLIDRAERVVVLTVDPEEDEAAATERLQRALRWHNAKTTIRHERGGADTVETLRATAKELGAGLLVMGGYGHSPLRELLFGGATSSMLADAELPVLMAH